MSADKNGSKSSWIHFAITTAFGIAWNVFDRWAQLQPVFEAWVPWVSPFVYAAVGAVLGYMICKGLDRKLLAAKDAECERRIAEILEPLPDVSRLTQTQARYVIHCWENMTSEGGIGVFLEQNDPVASMLVEDGVLRVFPDSPNSLGWVPYMLTPKWLEYVTAHEREVREAAGGGWT